jgi:hypothetical protein
MRFGEPRLNNTGGGLEPLHPLLRGAERELLTIRKSNSVLDRLQRDDIWLDKFTAGRLHPLKSNRGGLCRFSRTPPVCDSWMTTDMPPLSVFE